MINKHKSNKIKENSNTVRHLNNGTDHRHSKSCCDQSSPARRTIINTVAANGLGVQGARASAVMIAIVNMRCKQADFLPERPADVSHFLCL